MDPFFGGPAPAYARARGQPFSQLPTPPPVVVLAGGAGGAKLARGMLDGIDPRELVVIANTGDDIEIYGAHVSPDPDLVCFWLTDRIDERGWGLSGDTFGVMEALRELGGEVWFNLGDRDLAWCLQRAEMLAQGLTPSQALERLAGAIGLRARVLGMCEQQVRTWIRVDDRWLPFQRFMIVEGARGTVQGIELRGIKGARPSGQVLEAIAGARAIVIGPSNPLVSIDPILAVPGMREAIASAPAPVVAVSPIVGGQVLKGPTASFMGFAGHECSAAGIAEHYGEWLDGLVTDEQPGPSRDRTRPASGAPAWLSVDTRMDDGPSRARLATQVLELSETLRRRPAPPARRSAR